MEGLIGFGIFMVALLLILATGTPVAIATGLIGVAGVYLFLNPAAIAQLGNIAFAQSANFVLVVVPLFVMMGEVLAATTIGRDLVTAAQIWLRRVPGSLAHGTILACAAFGGPCGSSPVTAATIGSMAIPQMIAKGYDRRLAFGVTAAGGTLGILIPPGIPFILYGLITETSIGALFIAGIIPGILMTAMLSLTVFYLVWRNPSIAPHAADDVVEAERWTSLKSLIPVTLLMLAVLGTIYWGVATPTEAGAVGALGALIIAWVLGALKRAVMAKILDTTVRTTAMFILLIVSTKATARLLVGLDVPPWAIIVLLNLLLIVLGMFMDPMSLLVIIVPVFFPAVVALGYDPVWFGVVLTINIEIAAILPPLGFNLFVLKTVIPGADMRDIIRGSFIFVIPLGLGIVGLIIWPEIALWLPRLMMS